MSSRARWEAVARLIAENRDVLDARAADGDAPTALVTRGWAAFVLSLDDDALAAIEILGHDAAWPDQTPASLRLLIDASRDACALPSLAQSSPCPSQEEGYRPQRRRETARKAAQVEAFARLILPLATRATRVVDVGAGHGHLTREIADRIALPVVGLERDVGLADRARLLSPGASPSFAVTDVLRDGLSLAEGDCVIGLHACGELGDAIVEDVARSGAAVALVGCCLQKRRSPSRPALCAAPDLAIALDLPSRLLGLSNLTARDEGVEATRAENLGGRERRLALHRLLLADGTGELRFGSEIDGLNRRAAQGDLPTLVHRAFALRGRPPPSPTAIDDAATWAKGQYARARRLSLPRAMLARVLEVFVLLDRALYLEERGFIVRVGALFPKTVSARNLALVAAR